MPTRFSSVSPVDGEILWQGKATTAVEVTAVMGRSVEATRRWRAVSAEERVAVVRRYGQQLEAQRDDITDLISREVGKLAWDAKAEVGAAIAKIELSIQAFEQRRFDQVIDGEASTDSVRRVRYQPLGVALVLGPFNFPLHLPGGQIIPALLAGNAVVLKPSEQATAVGQWMCDAWQRARLPEHVFQMIPGGVETAVAAIDSPHVAGVFLTGSRDAGRAIHRQLAGRPNVLLALELGGNNPIVATDAVNADAAAALVSFSAFISAGQRCTCTRRAILMHGGESTSQLDRLLRLTKSLRVGMPGDDPSPHVGPLVSVAAAESLRRTYDQLLKLGCLPLIPFRVDSRAGNLVHPAIVDASGITEDSLQELGELEWFGPLLVVQRVEHFEAAIEAAARTPYGLAAALLGGTQEMFDRFALEVAAGVVNWNGPTTGAAGQLPFGGLGDSGNHRPAGFFAIDFCNDPVASLEHRRPTPSDPWSIVP